ncbi:hypothetical protein [Brevundimonas sp.]|uniref:hypothetical protein n=1 Tax=Brevundimonas sp. TaxID=1871086 RepID=UPI003BAA8761
MTEGVRPVSAVRSRDRRAAERRTAERREEQAAQNKTASTSRDLVPAGEVVDHPEAGDHDPATSAARTRKARSAATGAAAFAAQVLGQGGQRNGIRGGPPVMDAARATYLGAQYSGEEERRPPSGTTKRTEV